MTIDSYVYNSSSKPDQRRLQGSDIYMFQQLQNCDNITKQNQISFLVSECNPILGKAVCGHNNCEFMVHYGEEESTFVICLMQMKS